MKKLIIREPEQRLPIDDMWNVVAEVGQPIRKDEYIIKVINNSDIKRGWFDEYKDWHIMYEDNMRAELITSKVIAWMEKPVYVPVVAREDVILAYDNGKEFVQVPYGTDHCVFFNENPSKLEKLIMNKLNLGFGWDEIRFWLTKELISCGLCHCEGFGNLFQQITLKIHNVGHYYIQIPRKYDLNYVREWIKPFTPIGRLFDICHEDEMSSR